MVAQVQAAQMTLFSEDFESYNVPGDINPGIPLLSEGANELWYGGRYEQQSNGNVDQDTAVRNLPAVYPLHKKFARFEDDAGIMFHLDTTSLTDVELSFDWRTHLAESTDMFVAGYYVGDIDVVNDTNEGSAQPDLVHDFNLDGPAWLGGGWVEVLRDRDEAQWNSETFSLPSNESSVWVAFWLDNGEGDYGKVDNIVVRAIPEPASLSLLVLGALGIAARRRKN
jgi:hypothetical protein